MGDVTVIPLDETCQPAGPAVTIPGAVASWERVDDDAGEAWALTGLDMSTSIDLCGPITLEMWKLLVPAVFRRKYAHRYAKNMRRPAGWRLTGRWGYSRVGWATSTPVQWKVAVRRWDRLHG